MNLDSSSRTTLHKHSRRCLVSALWLSLALAAPLFGQSSYLVPGHFDGVALLAPPPAAGSVEEAADLASVRAVFKARTAAEEVRAVKDSGLAFSIFASAIGSCFEPAKLPKVQALLQRVKAAIGQSIDTPKNHWRRLRPYQVDEHLQFGEPEPSFSYPSGHSTRGTVYALVLSEIFPDKKQPILDVGRQIGWDRVLLGKHFPTDVYAGRVLGQGIFRELLASPAFQKDLAEARAEAEVAQAAQR